MIHLEPGEVHVRVDEAGKFTIHHYVSFYRQPLYRFLVWRLYHFWTWHFVWFHTFCGKIEDFFVERYHKKVGEGNCKHLTTWYRINRADGSRTPEQVCGHTGWVYRQDLRHFSLSMKGRKEIGRVYFDEVPKDSREPETVAGPPPKKEGEVNG